MGELGSNAKHTRTHNQASPHRPTADLEPRPLPGLCWADVRRRKRLQKYDALKIVRININPKRLVDMLSEIIGELDELAVSRARTYRLHHVIEVTFRAQHAA